MKHNQNRRPVIIHEDERELIFCRSNEAFVDHVMSNDPTLVGAVELSEQHMELVDGAFKDSDVGFISFGQAMYDTYAEGLGLQ